MAKNPYLDRLEKRDRKGHGAHSEKRVAKCLSAQLRPASGALASKKGDSLATVGTTKFLIESKSTIGPTLRVDLGWLVKIATEARDVRAVPALSMSFVDEGGKDKPHGDWVAFPRHFVEELFEALRK